MSTLLFPVCKINGRFIEEKRQKTATRTSVGKEAIIILPIAAQNNQSKK